MDERIVTTVRRALRPFTAYTLAHHDPCGMLIGMRARWIVVIMALGLVTFALLLEHVTPSAGSLLGRIMGCEPLHIVAHSILYGSLAVALATRWVPSDALDGAGASLRRRALSGAVSFCCVAGAQELTQAFSRSRAPGGEELFDLMVDVGGATLGLIAWSLFDKRRIYPLARALGVVLHPGFIGLVGVFALTWSTLRDGGAALGWTLVLGHVVLPIAVAALLATALVTFTTSAGTKVSAHVAVPVGLFVLLSATSYRGPWPFLLVALSVSWARVREGRHTPREVLAGWGIAGASGLLARLVG